jgi:hypothetical protein
MVKNLNVILLLLSYIISSCGPSEKEKEFMRICRQREKVVKDSILGLLMNNTFDAPFPKRNRNLQRILGDSIVVFGKCGSTNLRILSTNAYNLIINTQTNDTIFKGTVCRYRDLYYLSEQINKISYRIYALKITDSSIYGLQNYFQYHQIDTAISNGSYPKLVKYMDQNKKLIRLHPDKKELRRLFTSIIDKTEPFEIFLRYPIPKNSIEEDLTNTIEPDDFEMLSKAYPNPVKDILHIDLQQKPKATPYFVSDIKGKIVMQGQFHDISNKIDVSRLLNGSYILTINTSDKQKETIKIIKID